MRADQQQRSCGGTAHVGDQILALQLAGREWLRGDRHPGQAQALAQMRAASGVAVGVGHSTHIRVPDAERS